MKWKQEAMEKLRRYAAMCAALKNIPREIERLNEEVLAMRRADPAVTPVKGGGGQYDEALLNNIAKRQELTWALKRVKMWLTNAERGLLTLSEEERLVVQRLYMYPQKGALDRLCTELGMEQSSVYRVRDQALERFAISLYGFEET